MTDFFVVTREHGHERFAIHHGALPKYFHQETGKPGWPKVLHQHAIEDVGLFSLQQLVDWYLTEKKPRATSAPPLPT